VQVRQAAGDVLELVHQLRKILSQDHLFFHHRQGGVNHEDQIHVAHGFLGRHGKRLGQDGLSGFDG